MIELHWLTVAIMSALAFALMGLALLYLYLERKDRTPEALDAEIERWNQRKDEDNPL